MQSAPVSPRERQRLAALRALDVLDSPMEERYDRITRAVARIFDVPIALVSLVDADRQWFKSCLGLDDRQTPRGVSFCAHAILDTDVMQVPDTRSDERFRDNPLVVGDPHIRFYAGAPVHAPSGEPLGTLCIIDREPRHLDDDELELLADLAGWVEAEIAAGDALLSEAV
jgi:GAF domain-containing protein